MNPPRLFAASSIAVALLASACGPTSMSPMASGLAPRIDTMTPSEIRANYTGPVTLSGAGFVGASITANGQFVTTLPGATLTVVDDSNARIDFAYGGAGSEIAPGNYQITVKNGLGQVDAPEVLHVKTFLASVDYVRTLAHPFSRTAGSVDLFVRPRDFEGDLISPGHALVGTAGLLAGNFAWTTTSVTAVGSATQLPLPGDALGNLAFDFIGEGSSKNLAISIAIDQSGSMHGLDGNTPSDPTDERVTQAEAFVNALGTDDQVAVYSFAGNAGAVTLVKDFTKDKVALVAALETLRSGVGGGTPLWDAMSTVVAAAATRPADQFVRASVVLTDGKDTSSSNSPSSVIAAAQSAQIPVFSIGLGNPNVANSLDPTNMKTIADQTGGMFFLATDPSALQSVFNALESVLDSSYDVRADLTFTTPLPSTGAYSVTGTLTTTVDGVAVVLAVPTFTVSAL